MQITNSGNNGSAMFEDENGSGPPTIARYQNFGFGTLDYGLVTEFDSGVMTSTPEPDTLVLLSIGLLGIAGWRFRRV
jgi:PEP-CTERM motif